MDAVMLYGTVDDTPFVNTLLDVIRAVNGSALYMTEQSVELIPSKAKDPRFLVMNSPLLQKANFNKGIAVFKPGYSRQQPPSFPLPKEFLAIIDPENEDSAEAAKSFCLQTITCGLSQKDSLTFSSLDGDSAVISLQREMRTLKDQVVEPMELPVKFTVAHSPYAVLASLAILLLSDVIPDSESELII